MILCIHGEKVVPEGVTSGQNPTFQAVIFHIVLFFFPSTSHLSSLSQEDAQKYYSWRSFGPGDMQTQELWVDLNSVQEGQVRVHGILSNTHRQAAVRNMQ